MSTAVKTKTHTEYRKCNGIYTLVDWKSGPLTCQRPDSVVFVVNQTEISASVTQEMLFLIKGTRIRISLHTNYSQCLIVNGDQSVSVFDNAVNEKNQGRPEEVSVLFPRDF